MQATYRLRSRWITNGGPTTCFGCGSPFPHREGRIEAHVGKDGKLYCYDTICEHDALQAAAESRRRAS
jgi:hypothetical protein